MPTIPPMPGRLRLAAHRLGRLPLARVPVASLPRALDLDEAGAAELLVDLINRNMVRLADRPGSDPPALILTQFGCLVANVTPCPSGVRWRPLEPRASATAVEWGHLVGERRANVA